MASTEKALMQAERENQALKDRWKRFNEKNKNAIQQTVGGLLTGGSAFAFGYFQGRYPDRAQIGGVPASLVIGGGLLVGSAMGWIPEAEYVAPIGAGGLAAFGAIEGLKKGEEAKAKAGA